MKEEREREAGGEERRKGVEERERERGREEIKRKKNFRRKNTWENHNT